MSRRPKAHKSHKHKSSGLPPVCEGWQWPQLVDARSDRPTEGLTRLSDSLLFFLDYACQPTMTGKVEPIKLQAFFRILGIEEDKNLGNLPLPMFEVYYSVLNVEHTLARQPLAQPRATATSKIKKMIGSNTRSEEVDCVALTRNGLIQLLDLNCRRDPNSAHLLLSRAIDQFKLLDPASGHPDQVDSYKAWPPLPRSALPIDGDPAVAAFYDRAKETIVRDARNMATLYSSGSLSATPATPFTASRATFWRPKVASSMPPYRP